MQDHEMPLLCAIHRLKGKRWTVPLPELAAALRLAVGQAERHVRALPGMVEVIDDRHTTAGAGGEVVAVEGLRVRLTHDGEREAARCSL